MAWACPLNGPGSHPQDRPQMDATWKTKARRARTTWGRTAIAELKEMGSHGVRHSMLQRIGPVGYKSLKPYDYYTWLIGAVTNQEPRKTIGYCFENNPIQSKMAATNFSQ